MAEVVKMPKMSDTMTEGVLAKWHKKVGDKVKSGDLIAEIETDKATMDFESFQEGTLLYIGPKEGEAVPVDGVIAVLGKEGEEYKNLLGNGASSNGAAANGATAPQQAPSAEMHAGSNGVAAETAHSDVHEASTAHAFSNGDGRIKASPLAKKMAQEKGVDLSQVKGSADNGRIIKKDIEAYSSPAAASPTQKAPTNPTATQPAVTSSEGQGLSYEDVPLSQMRKTIAKRLSESMFTAPHFYLTMSMHMDKVMALRKQMNDLGGTKISFNDLVLKSTALSLRQHPKVNSSWLGDKIRYNHTVNIGVAVAVDEGLLVPVVRNADMKTLSQIAGEVKEFAQKAKDKKLQPSDWEGSTFTISNLGMMGIDEFTAIINSPDTCILAVGGIHEMPVVRDGQVVPGNVMKVTLSCDHRAVDGATGAAFLNTLKTYLEEPFKILI